MTARSTNTNLRSGTVLGMAALISLILLSSVNHVTKEPIEKANRLWLLDNLSAVLPEGPFDQNPVLSRRQYIVDELGANEPIDLYLATKNTKPVAIAMEVIAPDGYSGKIKILLGVHKNGGIIAARVIDHKETPGLGDDIEFRKSTWITQFNGLSLDTSPPAQWNTKRENGHFDALTGATVTSRAVIQAIYRALAWFNDNRDELFEQ